MDNVTRITIPANLPKSQTDTDFNKWLWIYVQNTKLSKAMRKQRCNRDFRSLMMGTVAADTKMYIYVCVCNMVWYEFQAVLFQLNVMAS